jgi:hypothetical protein
MAKSVKGFCENSGQKIALHFAQVSEPQKSRNRYEKIRITTILSAPTKRL